MHVLKIGGSVITKKSKWKKADLKAMKKIAAALKDAVAASRPELVIVHGAGSFGHMLVKKYGLQGKIDTKKKKQACKKVQDSCRMLSEIFCKYLKKAGIKCKMMVPHKIIVAENRKIAKFDNKKIQKTIANGEIPVLYGDMVPDRKLGFSVCSGDQIVAWLGKKSELVVFGTDVDGVIAGGRLVDRITKENYSKILPFLEKPDKPDVTGGMKRKIDEIKAIMGKAYIVNARYPNRIKNILLGKKAKCTIIDFS
ncbi:MAG: isopentenyl phosphate kinase [Candidatus Micrarchaeota archaeon]|nr:isopentenyl phosphate kinase [Candidatus Micrarchaeota archaeon]